MTEEFKTFLKVIKVIKSCKTYEQLISAKKYKRLFYDRFPQGAWSDLTWEIDMAITTKEHEVSY